MPSNSDSNNISITEVTSLLLLSNGSIFCRTFARWTRHSPPRPHSRPRRQSWLGGTWLPTQVYPIYCTRYLHHPLLCITCFDRPPFVSDHVWHVDGLRQRTRQVSYGYYKGLVRDMWWSQLSDTSVFCSNGTMHAIRSGRVQSWRSNRVVLRSLRSLHLLSAGPSARVGLRTVFSILYYYTCNLYIYIYISLHIINH